MKYDLGDATFPYYKKNSIRLPTPSVRPKLNAQINAQFDLNGVAYEQPWNAFFMADQSVQAMLYRALEP